MNNTSSLPYGWVKQTDPSTGHDFYVDTEANPPCSIWTHPYDDEVFMREHPDIRDKVGRGPVKDSAAPYEAPLPRQNSFGDKKEASRDAGQPKKHGLLDKLKNTAADAMEQRDERRRQQLLMHQQQQERLYGGQGGYGGGGMGMMGMPPNRYPAPQSAYPAGYGMGGGANMGGMGMGGMGGGMGGMGSGGRTGGMGGNMALPLMGGLAGGLLIGDVLDYNNGGDDGDGDYGGDSDGGSF